MNLGGNMFDITFICSLAGIVVSVIAVIMIFLTRNNILDILDKDIILFDKNFELKKTAINDAMNIVDEISVNGKEITLRPDFEEKAKNAHNGLLCIVTNVKIADEFYAIAVDKNETASPERIARFKIACRKDIGLKSKKSNMIRKAHASNDGIGANEAMLRTNVATGSNSGFGAGTSAFASQPRVAEEPKPQPQPQPSSYVPPVRRPMPTTQPTQQNQPAQPTQPRPNTMNRPLPTRPTPASQPRPMPRPTDENPRV